jgi:hypothetical protein
MRSHEGRSHEEPEEPKSKKDKEQLKMIKGRKGRTVDRTTDCLTLKQKE